MEARPDPLLELLLQTSKAVLLHLDDADRLQQIAGESAWIQWLSERSLPQVGASLAAVLHLLFDDVQAGRILNQHHALRAEPAPATPTGLAAAAHLLARGETPLVLEAGDAVGASIRQWAHVRFFSPWK